MADRINEPTPQGKAKVARLLAEFRASTQAVRDEQHGKPAIEPTTPDQAEMLRRIMALPDAPNVTAEHIAYRRKVEARIASVQPDHVEAAE